MDCFCFIIIPPAFLSAFLSLPIHRTLNDGCVIDEDDDGECAGEDRDDSEEL